MFSSELPSIFSAKGPRSLVGRAGQHLRRDLPAAPASRKIHAEDEDAKLTGMTRSLQRRVGALNFPVRGEARDLSPELA